MGEGQGETGKGEKQNKKGEGEKDSGEGNFVTTWSSLFTISDTNMEPRRGFKLPLKGAMAASRLREAAAAAS